MKEWRQQLEKATGLVKFHENHPDFVKIVNRLYRLQQLLQQEQKNKKK